MTTSVDASVQIEFRANLNNSVDVGSVLYPISFNPSNFFTDGTGANQAKEIFTDTRTLTASATENLDLAGVLADVFGNVLTFTKIKAMIITAAAANTNDVVVGGHATAAFASWVNDATDKIKVKPGGMFMITAPDANGLAVTATTADMLTVTNGGAGTSVTYTIVLLGVV